MGKAPPLEELTRYGIVQVSTKSGQTLSFYRRSLVRIHLEDVDEPLMGWCEINQRKEADASAES